MAPVKPVRIIDLSDNNGAVNMAKVKQAGIRGVMVKLTEGSTYLDPVAGQYAAAARAAKLLVGFYHYARPDTGGDISDATAEAHWFLRHLALHKGDLLPALDFEEPKAAHLGSIALNLWANQWLSVVSLTIGDGAMFYSYPSYIASEMAGGSLVHKAPLWLAAYGFNDGQHHPTRVPRGFSMVLHQFTSKGKVSGVPGDCDISQVSGALKRCLYAGGGHLPPSPAGAG